MSVLLEILPSHLNLEVRRGRNLLRVAQENSIPITYDCDGNGTCGTCWVKIERGEKNLSSETECEKRHRENQNKDATMRLSCQVRILGDVTIRMTGEK